MIAIGWICFQARRCFLYFLRKYESTRFKSVGRDFSFRGGIFSYNRITIGNNVYIGEDACFLSVDADIIIGSNVMFGPKVSIVTGDHRFDVIGELMTNVKEKSTDSDKNVLIEDDVWIGLGSIILKGVTIGKGCVVGARSVVSRSLAPYSIYVGNTQKQKRERFTADQIVKHEMLIKQKGGL